MWFLFEQEGQDEVRRAQAEGQVHQGIERMPPGPQNASSGRVRFGEIRIHILELDKLEHLARGAHSREKVLGMICRRQQRVDNIGLREAHSDVHPRDPDKRTKVDNKEFQIITSAIAAPLRISGSLVPVLRLTVLLR